VTITITPFTLESRQQSIPRVNDYITDDKKQHTDPKITYWGIYLDGKQVSYTSSKELAANTKVWIEKWLTENN